MAPALVFALTFAAPGRAAPAPDSLVRALVAQVSAESIRQTIQALQDMGTRYSYAPGCSLAGEHVLRRFRQAGADADYHGYAVPALAVELRLLPGGHGWLADTLGTLLHTSDGGEAWTERLGLDYHHLFGLDFADSLRGWAVGQSVFGGSGVVLHTSDGGMNWAVQTSFPLARLNRVAFASRDRGWAAGASRDSAIVARTGDGGRTWSVAGLGLRGEMRDLCATGGNRVWAVGLARGPAQGLVFHSGDGGASWREQLRTAGRLDAVCFVDSGNGWAAGADPAGSPALFRTATGGADWSACPPDSGFGLRDVGFSDREHGWCAGDSGFAYRTADAGTTWTSRRLGRRGLQAVRTADSLTAWFAGEGDTVLITTDAGASWRGRSPRGPLVWRNVLGTFRGSTAPDTVWMAS
ncbi:hypothetical protein FJY71_02805, partial [candidate division WOR-3 bacterium]|nr:hypothetical protein [candidate division WOR-3 bacterium]